MRQVTRCDVYEQHPPLKVIRAFTLPDGGALVHLHNISGGVLGGDQLDIALHVQESAIAQVTTTSATRIYRTAAFASSAQQITSVRVDQNGLLEYVPDTLIPYAGSRYIQQTRVDLADQAGLFWWETVAPGRLARDELFAFDQLQVDLHIFAQGRPLVFDRVRLMGGQAQEMNSLARLGPYRYMTTFYICKVGLEPAFWQRLENELHALAQAYTIIGEDCWGVSSLIAHGLVVRSLSLTGRKVLSGLHAFWSAAKQALYGQKALPPRKVY